MDGCPPHERECSEPEGKVMRREGMLLVLGASVVLLMAEPGGVVKKTQGFLPFAGPPINYRSPANLRDPVTRLNQRLGRGEVRLSYDSRHGYLPSVLELLKIPVSSQALVFSKTSLQLDHISPSTPRAIDFNDDVYVARVVGGKSLEVISFDPMQGAIFYVLSEHEDEEPRFERAQLDCVSCHIHAGTRSVPGVMIRSVATTASGSPQPGAPMRTVGHETPFDQRWAGWYVTGADPIPGLGVGLANSVQLDRYLLRQSDVVAQLVLAHQTQMHNYITEVNYRTRLGQPYEPVAEVVLRYLLFVSEAPLPGPIRSDGRFAREFASVGPRDRHGRSLREFDLKKRVFRYPCSYLIYSEAFDAIPEQARQYLVRRLLQVLHGEDQSPDFASLSQADRRASLEILWDTKPGLKAEWGPRPGEFSALGGAGRETGRVAAAPRFSPERR